jgi:hypothetical protein
MANQAFSGRIIWLLHHPSPTSVSARRATHRKTKKERQPAGGRGGELGDGGGAKSEDRKKAWSSINHEIVSDDIKISQGNDDISFTASAFHYCGKTIVSHQWCDLFSSTTAQLYATHRKSGQRRKRHCTKCTGLRPC